MIAFFTSAILLLVFAHLSGWFVVVALAAYLTVGVILPIITTKLAREDGRRYRELVGEMNDFFLDSIRGMKEIQLFGYAKLRLDEIQQRSQKIDMAFERIKDQEGKVRVYTEVAVSAFNIIMLFTGLILFSLDKIDFSAFLIGVILLMSSYGPVIALSNLSSNLLQTLASGERVLSLLAEEPELKDVESAVDLKEVSRIDVENVNFAYGEEQILSDVSLSVKKGEILGIHGRSGSGKSTLASLLMGYYPLTEGEIRLDGRPLSSLSHSALRQGVAMVQQDPVVLADTFLANVTLGRDISEERVWQALETVQLAELARSMSDGIYTPLGEQGNNLSVGQKQLLALARVLVETPQILILDEATASIDSGTEQAIQHALAAVREHTTLVVIAHRLSTIVDADTILVLHRGQAVEQGTHQQLLAAQGRYWQMYQLQLAGEELAASVREEESLSA